MPKKAKLGRTPSFWKNHNSWSTAFNPFENCLFLYGKHIHRIWEVSQRVFSPALLDIQPFTPPRPHESSAGLSYSAAHCHLCMNRNMKWWKNRWSSWFSISVLLFVDISGCVDVITDKFCSWDYIDQICWKSQIFNNLVLLTLCLAK